MQYVRSISGSVSKTWNSINPATLSGAIDVVVVQHADGTLSCSPFHVRFGKFSLLRPSEKKVEFKVNDVRQDYSMKLGEGGEAFFVFETTANVPEALQTSPLISPVASPTSQATSVPPGSPIPDLEPLDLNSESQKNDVPESKFDGATVPLNIPEGRPQSEHGLPYSQSFPDDLGHPHSSSPWPERHRLAKDEDSITSGNGYLSGSSSTHQHSKSLSAGLSSHQRSPSVSQHAETVARANSPPLLPKKEAVDRAMNLSKKLWGSNIPSQVNEEGDLMLDMTGYKTSEEEALRAEVVARKILSEELEGDYDIGSLIGADEKGNLWIYSSEEAKEAAAQKASYPVLSPTAMVSTDALSDPGYHSDDDRSAQSLRLDKRERRESDSSFGLTTPPDSPTTRPPPEPVKTYAKTLRLTSDQLKDLYLKPGPNSMSFSVNRATCQAHMYLWKQETPIVISDIDGTITKSDALGHVLNMIGRDWTHLGVAKLYSDIVANGYNILYLTSRSVGQADTTRTYINGIVQEGYKLPKGPVIMSPDRTIAALRREIYLRKPEVFKMACLRDLMSLFAPRKSPFYAGFGNRLTDALSYRSVNIPSTRIFTINSNAEVSLDLLSLNKYKTGYTSMRETVDHFFPPVDMLVQEGGEEFTDFNYWRDAPLDLDQLTASMSSASATEDEDDDDDDEEDEDEDEVDGRQLRSLRSLRSEDEGTEDDDDVFSDDMGESTYLSQRASIDDSVDNLARRSVESSAHDGRSLGQMNSLSESMHSDAPFEDALGQRPSLESRQASDPGPQA